MYPRHRASYVSISILVATVMVAAVFSTFTVRIEANDLHAVINHRFERASESMTILPSAFSGTWSGSGTQDNPQSSWTILLTLTRGNIGSVVGNIAYPSLRCGGKLTLLSIESGLISLAEDMTFGTSTCVDGGIVTLSYESPDNLGYEWYKEAWDLTPSTGELTRISSPGKALYFSYPGVWSGEGVQDFPPSSWSILIGLHNGSIGSYVGTIAYPSLRCGGTLTLMSVNEQSIQLLEDLTYGTSGCVNGGTVKLVIKGANLLGYEWLKEDWDSTPSPGELTRISEPPGFKLPYDENLEVYWTGGPHSYGKGGLFTDTYATGTGSGLDFFNGDNFEVLAMAAGTVIDASCDDARPLGCLVAIRYDLDDSVMVYGHLQKDSLEVATGDPVIQGRPLGNAGMTGAGSNGKTHLHIDLRDGSVSCQAGRDCLPNDLGGNPIGWDDGLLLDGYKIHGYLRDLGDPSQSYNYDGSAVKGVGSSNYWPFLDWPTKERKFAIIWSDPSYVCDNEYKTCEDNARSTLTQFAGNGALLTPLQGNNPVATGQSGDNAGILKSTNVRKTQYSVYLPLSIAQ